MKIYTKTGDGGTTRLVDGRECSKADLRVETYGSVDELNSTLGLIVSRLQADRLERLSSGADGDTLQPLDKIQSELIAIQNQLFNIGSHLACEKEEMRKHLPNLEESWILQLEKSIDEMTNTLSPLKNFILPGGTLSASFAHLGRTVCRRSERMVVRLIEEGHSQPQNHLSLKYLNRLSDYLFVVARFINHTLGVNDQIWQK